MVSQGGVDAFSRANGQPLSSCGSTQNANSPPA